MTLSGTGGVGKTRLALQVAAELSDRLHEEVYFVNLAPVQETAFVLSAIVQALALSEFGAPSLHDLVRNALGDRELLLLLDNFEQARSMRQWPSS